MAIKKSRKGKPVRNRLYMVLNPDKTVAHYGYDQRVAAQVAQDLYVPIDQHLPV